MNLHYFLILALLLLISILIGLIRVLRGPTPGDRVLAAQLFGTTTVGIFLLLGRALNQPAFTDVALVLALLAVILSAAFARRVWRPWDPEGRGFYGD